MSLASGQKELTGKWDQIKGRIHPKIELCLVCFTELLNLNLNESLVKQRAGQVKQITLCSNLNAPICILTRRVHRKRVQKVHLQPSGINMKKRDACWVK